MPDRSRDKIFLDIRQTFSIWFIPMYHAHVRLVTVLDLVAVDPAHHDQGEPLAIRQDGEWEEETDTNNDNDNDNDNGRSSLPGSYPGPGHGRVVPSQRLWRISRQEDLYQVNEFLKFVGPFWWCVWRLVWIPFQLGAAAVCVFLSLFVVLSPWARQKDPAVGGVEATVEQIEAYYDEVKPGKSGSRGSRTRAPTTPPHKHTKGRKKSTR